MGSPYQVVSGKTISPIATTRPSAAHHRRQEQAPAFERDREAGGRDGGADEVQRGRRPEEDTAERQRGRDRQQRGGGERDQTMRASGRSIGVCHRSCNLIDGGRTMTSHPALARERRAWLARPSSCACRSGGRRAGSVGVDQDGELLPEPRPGADQRTELCRDGRRGHEHERGVGGGAGTEMGECRPDRPNLRVRDPGEGVQEAILRQRGGRELGGAEAEHEAPTREEHADRGRGRDAPLERGRVGAAEGGDARIEEDEPARPPGRLVLADHQVARAGDRRPVDPPKIVTLLVGAHRVVLLAGPEQLSGSRGAEGRPRRRVRRGAEVLDLGRDEELLALVELEAEPAQRERIRHVHDERSQQVAPPRLRHQGVRRLFVPARPDPADHEAGRPSQRRRQAILQQEEGGADRRAVLDVERDRHPGPGADPDVGESPADRDLAGAALRRVRGEQGERGDADPDHLEAG